MVVARYNTKNNNDEQTLGSLVKTIEDVLEQRAPEKLLGTVNELQEQFYNILDKRAQEANIERYMAAGFVQLNPKQEFTDADEGVQALTNLIDNYTLIPRNLSAESVEELVHRVTSDFYEHPEASVLARCYGISEGKAETVLTAASESGDAVATTIAGIAAQLIDLSKARSLEELETALDEAVKTQNGDADIYWAGYANVVAFFELSDSPSVDGEPALDDVAIDIIAFEDYFVGIL